MEVTARDVTGSTTAAVAPEPKQVDNKVEPQKTEQLSSKYAEFARQQKSIREAQVKIQEARKSLENDRLSVKEKLDEFEKIKAWKQKLKDSPLEALNEDGITYDQLTQLMLKNPNKVSPEVMEMQKRMEKLEQERAQEQEKAQQHQVQAYENAKRQIRNDTEILINKDESFEAIKHYQDEGSVDAVVSLIEEVFRESNGQTLMPIEQAAKEVEEYLFEKSLSAAGLKKIREKLGEAQTQQAPQKLEEPQKTQSQTLSNRIVQSTAKPMTNRERRERAIAAFQGKQLT